MNDLLLSLSKSPQARQIVRALGLPIPMPQSLTRAHEPIGDRPLQDLPVAVWSEPKSALLPLLARVLAEAGADPKVADPATMEAFVGPGEAFGRPPEPLDFESRDPLAAVVLDATEFVGPESLRALYNVLHPLAYRLRTCARVVVIGRPPETAPDSVAAAAMAGLQGFVRSFAKEIGKRGATATLLRVVPGAEERLAGVLRFVMSARSAYVSGQALTVDLRVSGESPVRWANALSGKVALVTGAARGIGKETARTLAAEGATVVALDLPRDDGPTSALARELGGDAILCDLTSEEAPAQIRAALLERHGGVDIVVHNAGITRDKTLARMKPEWWDQAIQVNLGAVIRVTEALLEGAVLRDHGRLVMMSSIAGIAGNLGQTNYGTAKAAILGYVARVAEQVKDRGITVNAVAPGFIETRMTAAMPMAIREIARRMNNLGQGGQPIDVAQAVAFMAHPGSVGVTGQFLRVCGGSLVGR